MKSKSILIGFSLLISLFIYLFYRTSDTVINQIFIYFFSEQGYLILKQHIQNTVHLPQSIIYSLPEGLWIFSLSVSSSNFFIKIKKFQFPLILLPLMIAIAFECIQYLQITSGTYDLWDIYFSLAFWALGLLFWYQKSPTNNESLFTTLSYGNLLCLSNYAIVYLAHVIQQ